MEVDKIDVILENQIKTFSKISVCIWLGSNPLWWAKHHFCKTGRNIL